MSESTANTLREHNARVFTRIGPRLSTEYHTWIEARDPARGYVLLGGLGCCGVGQMWFPEKPYHAQYPGYADAPERDSTGGLGAHQ